jgi:hypothetical protein
MPAAGCSAAQHIPDLTCPPGCGTAPKDGLCACTCLHLCRLNPKHGGPYMSEVRLILACFHKAFLYT